MHNKRFCLVLWVLLVVSMTGRASAESQHFEDPADYPLMGDWQGGWVRPDVSAEKNHLAAQLIPLDQTTYRLRIIPALFRRAEAYLDAEVVFKEERIVYQSEDWEIRFEEDRCHGVRNPQSNPLRFELKKVIRLSPTLGQKPPSGAIVLFDGSDFDAWKHPDGRPLTWTLLKSGAMETVSGHWNDLENRRNGIGGSISTKQTFGSMKLHLEFRYAVEPGKQGQKRGNSGLFISGFKEVQILNSYGLPGYWNECGALYRFMPPHVNAAAPPLQWQSYDVTIELPEAGSTAGFMTVDHNGQRIQPRIGMDVGRRDKVTITLQDHNNALQFRNIWVLPLDSVQ